MVYESLPAWEKKAKKENDKQTKKKYFQQSKAKLQATTQPTTQPTTMTATCVCEEASDLDRSLPSTSTSSLPSSLSMHHRASPTASLLSRARGRYGFNGKRGTKHAINSKVETDQDVLLLKYTTRIRFGDGDYAQMETKTEYSE